VDHARAPSAAPAPRFLILDALRGACALIVFLSHWHVWSDFPAANAGEQAVRQTLTWIYDAFAFVAWPTGGHHPAVICFFVLSGFCIHYPFELRRLQGGEPPDWRSYFRRRFWRIMPVYWAAALLGLAFVAAERFRPTGYPLFSLYTPAPTAHIVVRLLGLFGVYPQEVLAGNHPLNTVAVELVLYVAYPLFCYQALRGRWPGLGAVFLGLQAVGVLLLTVVTPFWVFNSVFLLGLLWYAGAVAARWHITRGPRNYALPLAAAWLVFIGLKLMPHFYGLNILKQNAWGLVCAVGLLQCLYWEHQRPALIASAGGRMLRYAGEISYPLYAVHTPAMMLATWALLHLGRSGYTLQLVATFATSAAATLLAHHAVERIFYQPSRAELARVSPVIQTASRPA
jgi:peptidoglycan/LPS O-acetylase OafA/YrhL